LTFALCFLPFAFQPVVFAQCSMCKTGLLNSPEGQKLASGFNAGILFLLSVPFLVVGTVALLIFNAHRRREQKHRSASSEPPALVSESRGGEEECQRI